MKFRVIDGVAIVRNPEAGPAVAPEFTKDKDGKPVELTFRAGQICESKHDLRRNHVNKFERVHDDYVEQPKVVEEPTLDQMSLKQLQDFASSEKINLRGAKTKEEALRIIQGTMATSEA